jgi:hypothetical protein
MKQIQGGILKETKEQCTKCGCREFKQEGMPISGVYYVCAKCGCPDSKTVTVKETKYITVDSFLQWLEDFEDQNAFNSYQIRKTTLKCVIQDLELK